MLTHVFIRRLHVSLPCRLRAFPQSVPRTLEDFQQRLSSPPPQEGNLVRIAFIGDPNVGKSTIINKLLTRDICSVSNKPHTTRDCSPVAITSDDLQMVLVDTPGAVFAAHAKKHKLPRDMIIAPKQALDQPIDVLVAVIDAADKYRREYLSIQMARLLHKHRTLQPGTCSVLVLNKVDRVSNKRELLDCIDSLCRGTVANQKVPRKMIRTHRDMKDRIWEKEERRRMLKVNVEEPQLVEAENEEFEISAENPDEGTFKKQYPPRLESWPNFEKVFIVSATENDGIDDLREFLLSRARKGVWEYREDFVTNKDPTKLTEEIVKSKLLDHLDRDIPYNLTPKVVDWALDDSGSLHVTVNIECQQERQVRASLGKEGRTIKKISDEVREQMCGIFACEVAVKLVVLNVNKKDK